MKQRETSISHWSRQLDEIIKAEYSDRPTEEIARETGANYYTISSANDGQDRDPVSWVLYGSKDGGQWVELDRRENQKFAMRHQLRGFEIKKPAMCRQYKIEFLKNNGANLIQFGRVAFYE